MADNDSHEEDRKLFVGGLPQEVTQDDLDEYFGQFGELESAKLKMDPMTGRSRGFAFILYKEPDSIDRAADGTEHKLKGKTITVKKADVKPGKVYIGKLPDSGVGEDEIKEHFSQFGNIAEVIRPIDKMKNNEPKNFCFVTFERERVAKKLIEEGSCTINGHKMQIKQVTPNPRDPSQRGGHMGGGGGQRGGYGGSPWMNQGGGGGGWGGQQQGGWGGDGGYGGAGAGGYGGGQWGGDGGYGGGYGGGQGMGGGGGWGGQQGGSGGGQGGWNQGGGQWGGQGGGTWSNQGRGGGGKMRGGRGGGGRGGPGGRGRGNKTRPY